jgi:hypothetical protein
MGLGKIRTSTPGDPDRLKRELKDSGNDKWFYRVPANSEITVRFMAEPWDFTVYMNHFMDGTSFPCNEGDCKGCDEGNSASKTWIAPVLDLDGNRVRAMTIAKSIVDSLSKMTDRGSGTIMDRDITVIREGSTKEDTKYELYSEGRKRRDISSFEPPDIEGMLEGMLRDAMEDEEDDEDPPPSRSRVNKASKRVAKSASRSTKAKSRSSAPWDEDDEEDDEPPRSSTGRARRAAVKKPGRRSAPVDDDDPPRRGLSRAAKPVKKVKKTLRRR